MMRMITSRNRSTFVFGTLLVLGIVGVVGGAGASVFSDVTLGQAGPGGLNLAVFVTGGTFQGTNPSTTIHGNMGYAAGVTQSGTSDGAVTGTLYYQNSSSLTGIGNFNKNGTFTQVSLAQALTDVQNAATTAASLTPDQTFGNIGSSAVTITPSGIDTVVAINGNINITSASHDLTISGTASDFYIINVTGNITLTGGAIQATGGIPADHILFNLTGTNAQFTTQTPTSEVGTYLLPFSNDQITTHGNTINGALIGYNVSMTSGTCVDGCPFNPPSNVPEPLTLSLLVLGGLPLLRRQKKTH